MATVPVPALARGDTTAWVNGLDPDRRRRYREYLRFYEGDQWLGRPRPRETRLTLNYARIFIRKATTYLLGRPLGISVPPGADTEAAREQAARTEEALYQVYEENHLGRVDFETALDAAVLGDGAYKVTWDGGQRRVRVVPVDVQGLFCWWSPADLRELRRAVQTYVLPAEEARAAFAVAVTDEVQVVEDWTAASLTVSAAGQVVRQGPNPHGFIPYVVWPNVHRPKEFWGDSDLVDLIEPARELNRRLSVLSRILEVSGNPITVLENVEPGSNVELGPGALWELPADSRAYLLDLLAGGGVEAHLRDIDLLYRVLHDLAETPRTAFGDASGIKAGVAIEWEMQPLVQKVQRKRAIWDDVVARRNAMVLRLLEANRDGGPFPHYRSAAVWPPVLPQDEQGLAEREIALVAAGLRAPSSAMDRLGVQDPRAELARLAADAALLAEASVDLARGGRGES